MGWNADYVALFDEKNGRIDVQGWVTLSNNTGVDFADAEVQLVAGNTGGGIRYSPPAVSAHIKEVEDVLGVTLFERTSRGMALTAEGKRLLAKAEQTLAAHQALLEEAARSKGELRGTLRVGAGATRITRPSDGSCRRWWKGPVST